VLRRTRNKTFGAAVLSWFVLIFAAGSLAGCGKTVVVGQSKKADEYNTKLQRVLVAVNLQTPGMTNTHKHALMVPAELKQAFNAKLVAPFGVSVNYIELDGAANKVETLANAVSTGKPTQVLELKTVGLQMYAYVLDGYTIDASLYDTATRKIVWRSEVILPPFASSGRSRNGPVSSPLSHQNDADDVVDTLTAKLKADGLL
jgi:hypothetical protein